MQLTTNDRIRQMFKSEWLQKVAAAGLIIVDKEDLRLVMDGYHAANTENLRLRQRIRELESERGVENEGSTVDPDS